MEEEQRTQLIKVIVTFVLLVVFSVLPYNAWFGSPTGLYVQFVLLLIPYLIVGWGPIRKAVLGIAHGELLDENFLMTVASLGAFCLVLFPDSDPHMTEGVAVMLFYQVGELFEDYAVDKSRKSITSMMDIVPEFAIVERDGKQSKVDPDAVEIGSIIIVKPGERIPIDGEVVEGESQLDTAALTGESVPRDVIAGSDVFSGCTNITGVLRIKTTRRYDDSTVARVLEMVEKASERKARTEAFITRFARIYTPVVVVCAVVLAIAPPLFFGQNWADWVVRGLMFLVVSCPCALVISVPLSFFGGIGAASKQGILVKGSNYLEALSKTQTIAFDKTGTLTTGTFSVVAVHASDAFSESELLRFAAHAEAYSNHPIALSVREHFEESAGEEVDPECASEVSEVGGEGVRANVVLEAKCVTPSSTSSPSLGCASGAPGELQARPYKRGVDDQDARPYKGDASGTPHEVLVGNGKLLDGAGVAFEKCSDVGTVLYVAIDGTFAGSIVIADVIKPESEQAIRDLHAVGVDTCVMLTGDREKVAAEVAKDLGIDEYRAQLLPQDKVAQVERLLDEKPEGTTLAFVGDGVNDAPVLMRADVGIAMGAIGSDAAIEAADIVLMDDNPTNIAFAKRIAHKTMRIAYQNIVFAIAVKIVILILAMLGIANMWLAVFGDVGVSVIAILNAMRALRVKR